MRFAARFASLRWSSHIVPAPVQIPKINPPQFWQERLFWGAPKKVPFLMGTADGRNSARSWSTWHKFNSKQSFERLRFPKRELGAEARRDFFGVEPKKVPLFQRPKKPKKSADGGWGARDGGRGAKLQSTGEPPAS